MHPVFSPGKYKDRNVTTKSTKTNLAARLVAGMVKARNAANKKEKNGALRLFLRVDTVKPDLVFCTILVGGGKMATVGHAIFNRDNSEWENLRKRMGTNDTVPLTILPAETQE